MNKGVVHAVSREKLVEIATMYGVEIVDFGHIEAGYRNVSHSFIGQDGKVYNFILYKNEPKVVELIRRTNALGIHVGKVLPVRMPVDPRVLRVGRRYGSLYEYLSGQTIPWEAYTMKHLKLLGQSMAAFHTAATDYSLPTLPDVEMVYAAITKRMQRYFQEPSVQTALSQKLQLSIVIPDFLRLLSAAQGLEGRQALHMDLVRSNVLFREACSDDLFVIENIALSGILDLEKAAVGHPLFDVARTLAFLLVDCTKPEEKVRKYFLNSGYRKRGERDLHPVVINGNDLLEELITLFLTYDFYKFLKQNPYESLSKNHHFKRTVDILVERKVLHYSN